jgi:protein-S-isoprenylcysteine O-methyltransferase Ste14
MLSYIHIILPVYFIIYCGIAFVARSLIVARRTGINPLVLPKDDSAYGLVGKYFKITLIAIMLYTILFALYPDSPLFLPIPYVHQPAVRYSGLLLMFIALVWTAIAQYHMQDSWRIGIDEQHKTELITKGLFTVSRNPIFLGMLLSVAGMFMSTANGCTAILMIVSYILIQVQIRLEEAFLEREHGEAYAAYLQKVRRLI